MACEVLFTGDIMAQIAQNTACQTADGYDYRPVLAPVRGYLQAADLAVGNLETPFAGESARYSFARYSFNTPEEMARQVKMDGFGLVSLANNHCMDRDLPGLYHTLEVLDAVGLPHTGLARTPKERETPCILTRQGIRLGFLSYTYGTNAFAHHLFLPKDAGHAVNLLQPEETLHGSIHLLDVDQVASRVRALYETPNPLFEQEIAPRLAQLQGDIDRLREAGAEMVIMLLHCGGQRDPMPDAYTREMVRRIAAMGVDAMICNHQHILHPFTVEQGVPVAWCLGNLIQTPADKELPGLGSSYSALLRMGFERTGNGVRISHVLARLTRCMEDEKGRTVVYPLSALIASAQGSDREALLFARNHYVNFLRGLPDETPVEDAEEYILNI